METKVQNEWIDTGFGFPVKLTNVTMIKVRGNWTPKLDYNALAINVLKALTHKHSRLTGTILCHSCCSNEVGTNSGVNNRDELDYRKRCPPFCSCEALRKIQ
jgi:hypothetical protein